MKGREQTFSRLVRFSKGEMKVHEGKVFIYFFITICVLYPSQFMVYHCVQTVHLGSEAL